VIAQLDAHLDLLGVDGNYGRIWSPSDTNALFATAYQGLRDTGRRPGEVVSLRTQCVERDGEDWALVYDNHKKGRLRRRLPITAATAGIIQAWQVRRAGIDLPQCAEGWLFPAGCGFYRPDPSYLPAIEDHVRTLKADRETAVALGADDFVVRNLSDQADAYRQVAATMCDKLAALTDEERSEVEEASATLRKLRAGASVPVAFTKKAPR
jgi:integrase